MERLQPSVPVGQPNLCYVNQSKESPLVMSVILRALFLCGTLTNTTSVDSRVRHGMQVTLYDPVTY